MFATHLVCTQYNQRAYCCVYVKLILIIYSHTNFDKMNGKYIFATRLAVLVCISCIAMTAGAPTLKSVFRAYSRNVQVFFSLESPKTGTVTCGAFTEGNADLLKVSTCKNSGGSNTDCDQGASGICFSCTGSNSFTVTKQVKACPHS